MCRGDRREPGRARWTWPSKAGTWPGGLPCQTFSLKLEIRDDLAAAAAVPPPCRRHCSRRLIEQDGRQQNIAWLILAQRDAASSCFG